jgi:hypothetical protein
MTTARQIHISRDGQTFGPYSVEQVRQYLQTGEVQPTDWAWFEGAENWMPVTDLPDLAGGPVSPPPVFPSQPYRAPEAAFHHVSTVKFIIYSICSLGLYELVWFYKNWQYVRDRDGSTIMPFWRAIFSIIWCYPLAKEIADSHPRANAGLAGLAAVGFIGLTLTWKLPDPWSLLSLIAFIPLLYLVTLINQINRERGVRGPFYARVRVHHVLVCFIGTLLLGLALLGTFVSTPSTEVVKGDALPEEQIAWLRSSGVVDADEVIEFFYSTGVVSIKGQGGLVTNKRVISYDTEEDSEKLVIESAFYKDIKDIDVEYSESALDDTEVYISTGEDDEGFSLFLSAESKGDRRAVERLMQLWKSARESASNKPL